MSVSFAVTDGHGLPIGSDILDRQIDVIQDFLARQVHPHVFDVDVDASLARGEVTFSMSVDATDDGDALVRAIGVVVPAIRAVGGLPQLGQLADPTETDGEVWRPRHLALA